MAQPEPAFRHPQFLDEAIALAAPSDGTVFSDAWHEAILYEDATQLPGELIATHLPVYTALLRVLANMRFESRRAYLAKSPTIKNAEGYEPAMWVRWNDDWLQEWTTPRQLALIADSYRAEISPLAAELESLKNQSNQQQELPGPSVLDGEESMASQSQELVSLHAAAINLGVTRRYVGKVALRLEADGLLRVVDTVGANNSRLVKAVDAAGYALLAEAVEADRQERTERREMRLAMRKVPRESQEKLIGLYSTAGRLGTNYWRIMRLASRLEASGFLQISYADEGAQRVKGLSASGFATIARAVAALEAQIPEEYIPFGHVVVGTIFTEKEALTILDSTGFAWKEQIRFVDGRIVMTRYYDPLAKKYLRDREKAISAGRQKDGMSERQIAQIVGSRTFQPRIAEILAERPDLPQGKLRPARGGLQRFWSATDGAVLVRELRERFRKLPAHLVPSKAVAPILGIRLKELDARLREMGIVPQKFTMAGRGRPESCITWPDLRLQLRSLVLRLPELDFSKFPRDGHDTDPGRTAYANAVLSIICETYDLGWTSQEFAEARETAISLFPGYFQER